MIHAHVATAVHLTLGLLLTVWLVAALARSSRSVGRESLPPRERALRRLLLVGAALAGAGQTLTSITSMSVLLAGPYGGAVTWPHLAMAVGHVLWVCGLVRLGGAWLIAAYLRPAADDVARDSVTP